MYSFEALIHSTATWHSAMDDMQGSKGNVVLPTKDAHRYSLVNRGSFCLLIGEQYEYMGRRLMIEEDIGWLCLKNCPNTKSRDTDSIRLFMLADCQGTWLVYVDWLLSQYFLAKHDVEC